MPDKQRRLCAAVNMLPCWLLTLYVPSFFPYQLYEIMDSYSPMPISIEAKRPSFEFTSTEHQQVKDFLDRCHLPQYYATFIDEGFESLQAVCILFCVLLEASPCFFFVGWILQAFFGGPDQVFSNWLS